MSACGRDVLSYVNFCWGILMEGSDEVSPEADQSSIFFLRLRTKFYFLHLLASIPVLFFYLSPPVALNFFSFPFSFSPCPLSLSPSLFFFFLLRFCSRSHEIWGSGRDSFTRSSHVFERNLNFLYSDAISWQSNF